MEASDFMSLQEAYLNVYDVDYEVIDEGKVGLYTEPQTSHTRLISTSPYATMSPAMRMDAKAQELSVTEPGTTRENRQSRRAHSANVDFHSAANAVRRTQRQNEIRAGLRESQDLYDIVLEHLLYEGYADNISNAQVIMANMSDEWLGGILDEAFRVPRIDQRKQFLKLLHKKGGLGMGTPEDPHGYRDPNMATIAHERNTRITSARTAAETNTPDTYRTEREDKEKRNRKRGKIKKFSGGSGRPEPEDLEDMGL